MKKSLLCCLLMISGFLNISAQQPKVRSYLEIYDFDTKSHHVIKELPYLIEAPNWTPDGRWLVVNKEGKLYKTAPDGSTDLILIDTKEINQCNNDMSYLLTANGSHSAAMTLQTEAGIRMYILFLSRVVSQRRSLRSDQVICMV